MEGSCWSCHEMKSHYFSKRRTFGNAKIEEIFINGILWSISMLHPCITKVILLFHQMVNCYHRYFNPICFPKITPLRK